MIKEHSEETLNALARLAKAAGGRRPSTSPSMNSGQHSGYDFGGADGLDGSFHIAPIYVCDNPDCPDNDREAFPCGVYDEQGRFWNDLCDDCFYSLGCSFQRWDLSL